MGKMMGKNEDELSNFEVTLFSDNRLVHKVRRFVTENTSRRKSRLQSAWQRLLSKFQPSCMRESASPRLLTLYCLQDLPMTRFIAKIHPLDGPAQEMYPTYSDVPTSSRLFPPRLVMVCSHPSPCCPWPIMGIP